MTHTKGEWVATKGNSTGMIVVAPDQPKIRYSVAACGGPNREGNARLISAAPDLLEALKVAQLWLDVGGRYDMQGINAAIAKAEGRADWA